MTTAPARLQHDMIEDQPSQAAEPRSIEPLDDRGQVMLHVRSRFGELVPGLGTLLEVPQPCFEPFSFLE